jgi:hypothetical protein
LLLVTTVLVGWQGYRLLAGRSSLNVAGLAVQSGIVMVAIAYATQNLAVDGFGIVVACSVLAGWGRLAKTSSASTAPVAAEASPQSVHVAVNGLGTQVGVGGAVLALLTALVALAALSVRSNILFGMRGGLQHGAHGASWTRGRGSARSLSRSLRIDVRWRGLQDGVALLRRITGAHRVAVGFGGTVRPAVVKRQTALPHAVVVDGTVAHLRKWVRSPSWVHASGARGGRRGGQPGGHESGP